MAPPMSTEVCGPLGGLDGPNNKLAKQSVVFDHVEEEKADESTSTTLSHLQPQFPGIIQEALAAHGSPNNPCDQIRTLQEIMLDSERDICIFAGALDLLNKQFAECESGQACSVCSRAFESANDGKVCREQISVKRSDTEIARDESNVLNVYNATRQAVQELQARILGSSSAAVDVDSKFESRVSFNMRSGALSELRNQKAECLQEQRCFACLREFQGTDLIEYLRRVDWDACQMQERLHVHNK